MLPSESRTKEEEETVSIRSLKNDQVEPPTVSGEIKDISPNIPPLKTFRSKIPTPKIRKAYDKIELLNSPGSLNSQRKSVINLKSPNKLKTPTVTPRKLRTRSPSPDRSQDVSCRSQDLSLPSQDISRVSSVTPQHSSAYENVERKVRQYLIPTPWLPPKYMFVIPFLILISLSCFLSISLILV